MNRRERIIHNIGILIVGIFIGVSLCVMAYEGVFCREPEPRRINIPISKRESTWASGAR